MRWIETEPETETERMAGNRERSIEKINVIQRDPTRPSYYDNILQ